MTGENDVVEDDDDGAGDAHSLSPRCFPNPQSAAAAAAAAAAACPLSGGEKKPKILIGRRANTPHTTHHTHRQDTRTFFLVLTSVGPNRKTGKFVDCQLLSCSTVSTFFSSPPDVGCTSTQVRVYILNLVSRYPDLCTFLRSRLWKILF